MFTYDLAVANPELAYSACIVAAHNKFPHLAWHQVDSPPKNMLDAALARQFGLYVLVIRFGVPKKRVCKIAKISREVFWRFLPKFEERMETPEFRDHVDAVELEARQVIERRISEIHEEQKRSA
jgi:hypothetical protein